MVGGGAFYTSNGSWAWALGAKLYLRQDRYRLTGLYGHAQVHYDLYGIGNSAGALRRTTTARARRELSRRRRLSRCLNHSRYDGADSHHIETLTEGATELA